MTIFVADAHRDDRKHLVVRSDEKGTAFVELQSAIYPATVELSLLSNRSWRFNLRRSAASANKAEPSSGNVEPASGTGTTPFM